MKRRSILRGDHVTYRSSPGWPYQVEAVHDEEEGLCLLRGRGNTVYAAPSYVALPTFGGAVLMALELHSAKG
jgi:hypothetical protein